MTKMRKSRVSTGIYSIEVPDADVYVLCDSPADSVKHLMAGSFVGEFATLSDSPAARIYRAKCFVKALKIHLNMYRQLFEKVSLTSNFYEISRIRRFLQRTWLFGEGVSNPVLNRICRGVEVEGLADGAEIAEAGFDKVYVVREGAVERAVEGTVSNRIEETGIFGETVAMFGENSNAVYRAVGPTKLYGIPPALLGEVPVVQWKLLELFRQDVWVDEAAE